jgi:Zn-dependent protease/CBS domain-containing protein
VFGKQIKLFSLLGFKVSIDLSWTIIAILVTWSLATGVFPRYYDGLSPATYWGMGVLGALGLFLSIVIHEFSHSFVARRFGIPMRGITLFLFGGVAEMEDEPPSARAEFHMSVVGPITSVVVGAIFYVIYVTSRAAGWPTAATGILGYLGWINFILAAFNILPAFPLDGGRVLRSALWSWKGNIRWATRVSSSIGSGFGIALIVIGVFSFIRGAFVAGMWWVLIGLFLRRAAQASYQRIVIRKALEGEPVRRFMQADPVSVNPSVTIERLVEDYIYRHHFKMFPVTEEGKLKGCITTREVKAVPRERWSETRVGDILIPCATDNTIGPDTDAVRALMVMNRTRNSRLMVVENGKLVGIVSLKDLLGFLSIKMDLAEESLEVATDEE